MIKTLMLARVAPTSGSVFGVYGAMESEENKSMTSDKEGEVANFSMAIKP